MTHFFDAHVLVTGAASGLGRLMALEAVHRKARVLPPVLFDAVLRLLGVSRSMDHFRGRQRDQTEKGLLPPMNTDKS